eukprot:774055-Pelagomonas_calceolata.AAC.1
MRIDTWAGGNKKPHMHREDGNAFRQAAHYNVYGSLGARARPECSGCSRCWRACMAELAASAGIGDTLAQRSHEPLPPQSSKYQSANGDLE